MDWDQIYRDHYDRVFRTLYGRTSGDKELALDLTHDVFVRAMRSEHQWRYDDGRGIGPWLTTIAVNLLRDHFKSGRFRFEWPTADMADADRAVRSAEDEALVVAVGEAVRGVLLAKVTDKDREALVLRYWGGCSIEETAHRLRRTTGAVKTAEHRGKVAMRHSLRTLAGVA